MLQNHCCFAEVDRNISFNAKPNLYAFIIVCHTYFSVILFLLMLAVYIMQHARYLSLATTCLIYLLFGEVLPRSSIDFVFSKMCIRDLVGLAGWARKHVSFAIIQFLPLFLALHLSFSL